MEGCLELRESSSFCPTRFSVSYGGCCVFFAAPGGVPKLQCEDARPRLRTGHDCAAVHGHRDGLERSRCWCSYQQCWTFLSPCNGTRCRISSQLQLPLSSFGRKCSKLSRDLSLQATGRSLALALSSVFYTLHFIVLEFHAKEFVRLFFFASSDFLEARSRRIVCVFAFLFSNDTTEC